MTQHKKGTKILFHKDGKLSTVDVIQTENGHVILSNNGKPDAGIHLYDAAGVPDEVTMILLGALPIAINPQIKTVANIGMSSEQIIQTKNGILSQWLHLYEINIDTVSSVMKASSAKNWLNLHKEIAV